MYTFDTQAASLQFNVSIDIYLSSVSNETN